MKASKKCKALIKHYEGVRSKPYKCPAGLYTVGVGHLIGDGKTLPWQWNRLFTNEEIDEILSQDLIKFERGVSRLCPGPLTQGQFDALVSFSFNVGLGNLQRSSIRMKTNRGEKESAAQEFMKWTKAAGKVLPGLVKRRKDETALYLS
jgi:lysozyme